MVLSVTLNLAYMKSVIYVLFSAMFQTVVELMLVVALKEINKTLEVNFSCLDNKDAGGGGGGWYQIKRPRQWKSHCYINFAYVFKL